jgi:hypothetical protein
MRCDKCRFWDDDVGFGNDRPCHRMPPVMMWGEEGKKVPVDPHYGMWPLTSADDWCGEFKQKNPH